MAPSSRPRVEVFIPLGEAPSSSELTLVTTPPSPCIQATTPRQTPHPARGPLRRVDPGANINSHPYDLTYGPLQNSTGSQPMMEPALRSPQQAVHTRDADLGGRDSDHDALDPEEDLPELTLDFLRSSQHQPRAPQAQPAQQVSTSLPDATAHDVFGEASSSQLGAKLLFFPAELELKSSHIYTPLAASGKLVRRLPTVYEREFFTKRRQLQDSQEHSLEQYRFHARTFRELAVALQDKESFLRADLTVPAQRGELSQQILEEVQDLLRAQKADRCGLVASVLPASVIGAIFELMASESSAPIAFPSAASRGFTPMLFKNITVNSSRGPSLTVKAVRRPLEELRRSNSEHVQGNITSCLFDRFYIAHVTFDLSDPSWEWTTLLRPWQHFHRAIRRILITIVGVDDCHPYAVAEFIAFVSMSNLLCRIDRDLDLCESAQAELLARVQLAHSDDTYCTQPPSILGFQELDLGRYLVLDTPLASEYFQGTLHHTRSHVIGFVNALFELGRGMRPLPPMNRRQVRRECYDWMLSSGRNTLAKRIASKNIEGRFQAGSFEIWVASQPAVSTSRRRAE
jgi:hypothetical protein